MKTVLKIILLLFCFSPFSMFAQDLIVPKQGDPITAYNVETSAKFYFYTTIPDANAPIFRIAKDSVLVVRFADGRSVTAPSEQTEVSVPSSQIQEDVKQYPIINEEDIHGCLIEKGNCVYIPTDALLSFDKAGQEKVKELVSEWGYWTVVDKPEQAHFILHYTLQTGGSDYAFLLIRPRKYYRVKTNLFESRSGWDGKWDSKKIGVAISGTACNEDLEQNKKTATTLVERMKIIILNPKNKNSKQMKNLSKYLDADSEDNNYPYPIWRY